MSYENLILFVAENGFPRKVTFAFSHENKFPLNAKITGIDGNFTWEISCIKVNYASFKFIFFPHALSLEIHAIEGYVGL